MTSSEVAVIGAAGLANALVATERFSVVHYYETLGELRDGIGALSATGPDGLVFLFADDAPCDVEGVTVADLIGRLTQRGYRVVVLECGPQARGIVESNPGAGLLPLPVSTNLVLGALSDRGVGLIEPCGEPWAFENIDVKAPDALDRARQTAGSADSGFGDIASIFDDLTGSATPDRSSQQHPVTEAVAASADTTSAEYPAESSVSETTNTEDAGWTMARTETPWEHIDHTATSASAPAAAQADTPIADDAGWSDEPAPTTPELDMPSDSTPEPQASVSAQSSGWDTAPGWTPIGDQTGTPVVGESAPWLAGVPAPENAASPLGGAATAEPTIEGETPWEPQSAPWVEIDPPSGSPWNAAETASDSDHSGLAAWGASVQPADTGWASSSEAAPWVTAASDAAPSTAGTTWPDGGETHGAASTGSPWDAVASTSAWESSIEAAPWSPDNQPAPPWGQQDVPVATDHASEPFIAPVPGGPRRKGLVIAVCVSKGGAGKSSLTLNLGVWLATKLRAAGRSVCIVDANWQQADIGKQINAYNPNIAGLSQHTEDLDPQRIGRHLYTRQDLSASFLLGPARVEEANPLWITPALYSRAVDVLRDLFDYIVVDSPVAEFHHELFTDFILPRSDFLLVPVLPNWPTIINTDGWLRAICTPTNQGGHGFDERRIGIVLNRAEDNIGFDENQVQQELGSWHFLGSIPDSKEWRKAANSDDVIATRGIPEIDRSFAQILYAVTQEEMLLEYLNTPSAPSKGRRW